MMSSDYSQIAIREFHLFAGIGGGILGGMLNNHTCVGASEIDKFCKAVLEFRMNEGSLPAFDLFGDIRTLDGKPFRKTFDILSGGFPCQPFSSAARGRNLESKNMWPQMLRFALESEAPIVFAENVNPQPILKAKHDLESFDYRVECCLLSASDLGACHRRNRYWLLAYSNGNRELFSRIYDETRMLPKLRQGIWKGKLKDPRMANEFSNRLDKLKATGNAQVPIVAAVAFRILVLRLSRLT
jgi:site-specific DNA-cytosine methylase